jgi:hypothetical protein
MPTIKRLMDVVIVGMVVFDLMLTVLFFSRARHAPQARSPQPAAVVAPPQPSTPTVSTAVAGEQFLLLKAPGAGDAHELFTCPAADAQKWDYGGGTNTAQNWCNWNGNATEPTTTQVTKVNAAMFLLLRAGDITSEVFTCPATQPSKWDYRGGIDSAQN